MKGLLAKALLFILGVCCAKGKPHSVVPHTTQLRVRNTENPSQCVLEVIRLLSLDEIDFTDPDLLRTILKDDMLLDDLETVQMLLGDSLTKKMPLGPMIAQVRRSLISEHPIVEEFLCKALDEDLIQEVENEEAKEVIKRSMHHAYILDLITKAMANDNDIMMEIQNHLLEKRKEKEIPTDFMELLAFFISQTGQPFMAIKTVSMDLELTRIGQLRSGGEISQKEMVATLQFNILEACLADRDNLKDYTDNAMAGIALTATVPDAQAVPVAITEDDRSFVVYFELSQEWVSLYESWNLAFITGNLNHLDMLYPKLLIPSVIDTEANEYMFNRVLALWLSVNFYLFAQFKSKPNYAVPNAEELAQLWGGINREHANNFMKKNGMVLDELLPMLTGTTYLNLWERLSPVMVSYGVLTEEDAALVSKLLIDVMIQADLATAVEADSSNTFPEIDFENESQWVPITVSLLLLCMSGTFTLFAIWTVIHNRNQSRQVSQTPLLAKSESLSLVGRTPDRQNDDNGSNEIYYEKEIDVDEFIRLSMGTSAASLSSASSSNNHGGCANVHCAPNAMPPKRGLRPTLLQWSGISCTYKAQGKAGNIKQVMKDAHGELKAGDLLAIMGPRSVSAACIYSVHIVLKVSILISLFLLTQWRWKDDSNGHTGRSKGNRRGCRN